MTRAAHEGPVTFPLLVPRSAERRVRVCVGDPKLSCDETTGGWDERYDYEWEGAAIPDLDTPLARHITVNWRGNCLYRMRKKEDCPTMDLASKLGRNRASYNQRVL